MKYLALACIILLGSPSMLFAFDQEKTDELNKSLQLYADKWRNRMYDWRTWQKISPDKLHADAELFRRIKELVCHGANPDQPNKYSSLSFAIDTGNIGLMEFLVVEHGVKIDGSNSNSLLEKAMEAEDSAILQWLVSHGADIEAVNGNGYTMLMVASMKGDLDAIELLVAHGAKTETKSKTGSTAIMFAAEHSKFVTCAKLLRLGANIYVKTNNQKGLLKYSSCTTKMAAFFEKIFPYELPSGFPKKAIEYALETNNAELGKLIIDELSLNKEDSLHDALRLNSTHLFELILTHRRSAGTLKSSIDRPNVDGFTLFEIAIFIRNDKLVELLLDYDADPMPGLLTLGLIPEEELKRLYSRAYAKAASRYWSLAYGSADKDIVIYIIHFVMALKLQIKNNEQRVPTTLIF